jgi:hypothetical protein
MLLLTLASLVLQESQQALHQSPLLRSYPHPQRRLYVLCLRLLPHLAVHVCVVAAGVFRAFFAREVDRL